MQADIDHRVFTSRFKSIRKQRDYHFGEYHLMKDTKTRKRVIVKHQPYSNEPQLKNIIQGLQSLIPLRDCPYIVSLLGYCIHAANKSVIIIYEYHDSSLEESLKSSSVHNQNYSQKAVTTFIENMTDALKFLEELGLNHLDIKPSNILEQNKDSLNMKYKLFYTNYTVDAVIQIKSLNTNVEDYCLSEYQLEALQKSSGSSTSSSEKIRSDLQAVGLLALQMGTLNNKQKFYSYGEDDRLRLNEDAIGRKMRDFRRNYSKKTIRLLQLLIYGKESEEQHRTASKSRIGSSRVSEQARSRKSVRQSHPQVMRSPSEDRVSERNHKTQKHQKYYQSLEEIQRRIIYKPRTKDLLPGMQQKKYADNSKYIGQLSQSNQRQGKGIYYYAEGDVYAGEWQDNTLQGYGIYLFCNGQKYEGEVLKGVKYGKGQYVYSNNNRYVGDWQDDKKHGYGTYFYYDKGDVYEGYFVDGSKEGRGKYTYSNGDYYQGNFLKGERSGEGNIYYLDGTVVSGIFQFNELVGKATIKYSNHDTCQANFVKSSKNGTGRYRYSDGTEFQGNYQQDQKTGTGHISYHTGDQYKGTLHNGQRHGYGVYTYKNRCEYQGNWETDRKHGHGQYIITDGTTVSTTWINDVPNSTVQITYPNGDTYEGQANELTARHGMGKYTTKSGEILEGQFRNNEFQKGKLTDRNRNIFFID